MPFVRNPRDRNKQIETQQSENNALSKDLGTVGSVGGALLQDKAPSGTTSTAPTLSSPSPERKTAPLRATNLAEYGRANIGKTEALGQSLASRQAQGVRDFNQRLAESGGRIQSSLDQSTNLGDSRAKAEDFLAKSKEGTLTHRDYTDLQDAFKGYQGPKTLADIDPSISREQESLANQNALGNLSKRVGDQSGYTTGVGTLDAALVGRQSQALQDTGRAAAGAGAELSRVDDRLTSLTDDRATNLAKLIEDTRAGITGDFDRTQGIIDTKYETTKDQVKHDQNVLQELSTADANLKVLSDAYNEKGRLLNNINIERATKGWSPDYQQKLLAGLVDPTAESWQSHKTHLDGQGWGEDEAWNQATEVMKLKQATWDMRLAKEAYLAEQNKFTQTLQDNQADFFNRHGIDPAELVKQMNYGPGTFDIGGYNTGGWDTGTMFRNRGYTGSASQYNPKGYTSTMTYNPLANRTSLADLLNKNIQLQDLSTLTPGSVTTPEQRSQIAALQYLAGLTGDRLQTKDLRTETKPSKEEGE